MRTRHRPRGGEPFPGFTDVVEVGRGSAFDVFRAVEVETARPVALKGPAPNRWRPGVDAAFEEQVRILGALGSHPNVVGFYRTARSAESLPVLVLEQCRESLAERLQAAWRPAPAEVVATGIKLAGALESAHAAGHVHGGVAPGKVLVSTWGEPVLGGFGDALVREAAGAPLPATTHAAPEVLEGSPLGPATDVYGLASTLYELLTGRTPFAGMDGESPAATILRIVRDPVAPVVAPGIPLALSDLLVAALSKSPGERPGSAAELARRLAALATGEGWPVPVPVYPGAVAAAPAPAAWRPPQARPAVAMPGPPPAPPADEAVTPEPVPAGDAARRPPVPQRRPPAPRPSVVVPAAGQRRVAEAVPVAERPGPARPAPPAPAEAATPDGGEAEDPDDGDGDAARRPPFPPLPPLQAGPPPRRGQSGWRPHRGGG